MFALSVGPGRPEFSASAPPVTVSCNTQGEGRLASVQTATTGEVDALQPSSTWQRTAELRVEQNPHRVQGVEYTSLRFCRVSLHGPATPSSAAERAAVNEQAREARSISRAPGRPVRGASDKHDPHPIRASHQPHNQTAKKHASLPNTW